MTAEEKKKRLRYLQLKAKASEAEAPAEPQDTERDNRLALQFATGGPLGAIASMAGEVLNPKDVAQVMAEAAAQGGATAAGATWGLAAGPVGGALGGLAGSVGSGEALEFIKSRLQGRDYSPDAFRIGANIAAPALFGTGASLPKSAKAAIESAQGVEKMLARKEAEQLMRGQEGLVGGAWNFARDTILPKTKASIARTPEGATQAWMKNRDVVEGIASGPLGANRFADETRGILRKGIKGREDEAAGQIISLLKQAQDSGAKLNVDEIARAFDEEIMKAKILARGATSPSQEILDRIAALESAKKYVFGEDVFEAVVREGAPRREFRAGGFTPDAEVGPATAQRPPSFFDATPPEQIPGQPLLESPKAILLPDESTMPVLGRTRKEPPGVNRVESGGPRPFMADLDTPYSNLPVPATAVPEEEAVRAFVRKNFNPGTVEMEEVLVRRFMTEMQRVTPELDPLAAWDKQKVLWDMASGKRAAPMSSGAQGVSPAASEITRASTGSAASLGDMLEGVAPGYKEGAAQYRNVRDQAKSLGRAIGDTGSGTSIVEGIQGMEPQDLNAIAEFAGGKFSGLTPAQIEERLKVIQAIQHYGKPGARVVPLSGSTEGSAAARMQGLFTLPGGGDIVSSNVKQGFAERFLGPSLDKMVNRASLVPIERANSPWLGMGRTFTQYLAREQK